MIAADEPLAPRSGEREGPAVRREGEGHANPPDWKEAPPSPDARQALLKPYPAERITCFKIDPKIGNVKYDEPSLVEPV